MANEDKTITIKFRGDTTQLDTEVSNVDKMIKVLQADTRAVSKKMKFGDDYATQMKYYDEAISNVSETIRLAQQNQDKWNAEIEKYHEIMKTRPLTEQETGYLLTAERKFAEYGATVENTTKQLNRYNKEKANFNRLGVAKWLNDEGTKMDKLAKGVGKVADAFKYLSLGAGATLTASANAAITFESAMANVNKVLKESEKNYLGTLEQQILDMSKALPLTAQEIAQTTANALQLGIAAKDVGKFTETILKLGTATNVSAEEAAISIAQLFNITGEQFDNIDKFGAALTSLGNQFPTFESDILEMSQRIAAAGSSVGMTTTDILGLSTALTSMGLSAEAGGTAISTILRNIDTLVATNSRKLESWAKQAGMSTNEFRQAWTNNVTGTFQQLVNNIAKSVDEGENLNTILGDLGISAIRQKDAFSRLVQANDTLNDALYESRDAWNALARGEEGALNDEFAEKVKTLAAQLQLLKNDLYYIGVQIGNNLMPILQKVVDKVREIVDWFANLSPEAKQWITNLLIGIAAVYPALKGLQKLLEGTAKLLNGFSAIIGTKLIPDGAGEKMFGKLITIIKTFTKTMAMPIAIISAVAAAFAVLYKTFEPFRNAINGLADSFKNNMVAKTQELLEMLKLLGNWISAKLQPLFALLGELYHKFIEPTLAYLLSAGTKLVFDVIQTIYEWLVKIIGYIIKIARPVIEVVIGLIKAIATFLSPIAGTIFVLIGAIIELVGWLWDKLKPAIDETITIVGNIVQAFAEVAKIIIDVVLVVIQWLIDKFAELFGFLQSTDVVQSFSKAFEGVVTVIKNAVEWFTKLLDKFAEWRNENPSLGDIKSNWENQTGQRAGSTGVMPNIFNVNQRNTFNGTTSQQTVAAANNMIDLINNGLGKKLTF